MKVMIQLFNLYISSIFTGYRFLLEADRTRRPIAILNIGQTRADHLAHVKVTARCGEFFERYKTLNL